MTVRELVASLLVCLREPLLLIAWSVVVAAVLGVGRGMGLPLLFWHERKSAAFWAGLAATLLTAEIFFVLFLIHADVSGDARACFDWFCLGEMSFSLTRHLLVGGVLWTAIVLAGAVRIGRQGIAPRAHGLDGDKILKLKRVPVRRWPFLAGVVAAAALVAGAAVVDARLFGATPTRWHLHEMAAVVTGALLVIFIFAGRSATPAVGLSALLAMLASAYGVVTFWTGSRGLLLAGALVAWLVAGRNRYRLRLPALKDRYPSGGKPVRYPPTSPPTLPGPPLLFDALVTRNGAPGAWPGRPERARRPLVLVCASGGGIRAGVWTAGVLGRLDAHPGFRPATRMITGASGGMVGAAIWAAWHAARAPAADGPPTTLEEARQVSRCVAMDSLTPLAQRLFFHDAPRAFWPGPNPSDRGRALEEAWQTNVRGAFATLKPNLAQPLADLRAHEASGALPSLVFTPMMVEDGRRLILSNLALDRVLRNEAGWLETSGREVSVSSVTAFHAAALFPEEWPRFPLSTAARLSASFPYASPAVVLPTEPRRRVVDAGYYDNYGMSLTCGWLREALDCHARWLREHVSRILVVQIRDNVSNLSINPESESEQQKAALSGEGAPDAADGSALSRGLEGLTSPPEGLLAARDSVSLFRSDAQLQAITHAFKGVAEISTVVFEFQGEASLSWYLPAPEQQDIEGQLDTDAIAEKVRVVGRWLDAPDGDPCA